MIIDIHRITTGRWRENCYIVHDETGEAVIIDPGGGAEQIIEYVEAKRLKVNAILNTHAHYDHIGAVAAVQTEFSAPFYLHSKDLRLLKSANLFRKVFDGDRSIQIPTVDVHIDHVETPVRLGRLSIQFLPTAGHSLGGVSFLIGHALFTGDTILKGKVGRVDLPGGDTSALRNSLRELSLLPADLKIYPGHGESSTIRDELQQNSDLLEAIF